MTFPGLLRTALLVALLTPCAPVCFAQGDTVKVRFLSFPKKMQIDSLQLRIGPEEAIEIDIPSNELSKTYQVPRQSVWAVGEWAQNEKGDQIFKSFGHAKALSSSTQLILLVRKGEDLADGLEVLPINNQVKHFGGGKFLFMNASKVDVAGEAGGKKFVVRPGKHTIVEPEAQFNGRTFHAMFYFRSDEGAKPFFSSKWPTSKTARGLIFFYHDPNTRRLRLHSIRDFL
jgi:hypothetical protein